MTVLGIVALIASSIPITVVGETVTESGCDECCEHETVVHLMTGGAAASSDHCCSEGCDDCFMPCCVGLTSLEVSPVTLHAGEVSSSALVAVHEDAPATDPEAIYHPPQR